jgi:hypothetical protein
MTKQEFYWLFGDYNAVVEKGVGIANHRFAKRTPIIKPTISVMITMAIILPILVLDLSLA